MIINYIRRWLISQAGWLVIGCKFLITGRWAHNYGGLQVRGGGGLVSGSYGISPLNDPQRHEYMNPSIVLLLMTVV